MRITSSIGALAGVLLLCALSPGAQAQDGEGSQDAVTAEDFEYLEGRLDDLTKQLAAAQPGRRSLVVTGYSYGGFRNNEGADSSFYAGFNPIFLFAPTETIFFEGEAEFELADTSTAVALEYAQMSQILNDKMTLSVGKFLNPANLFQNRLHPKWINKLPDRPLIIGPHRLQGHTQLGVQLHGGMPIGAMKMNYSVFVSNGPSVKVGDNNYGGLGFKDLDDSNNAKEIGGRVGFFPTPDLEIGGFLEIAGNVISNGSPLQDAGPQSAGSTVYGFDVNYTANVAGGRVDGRVQWVWSDVDDLDFDPPVDGARALDNTRDGGYVQLAYRPTESGDAILSKMEGVVRYDSINLPAGAPEGGDESRIALGLNYWWSPASVFKVAYVFDDKDTDPSSDQVMFEWALGF